MSKILAIDTATKYIYISLIIDGEEVASVYEEGINNHSVTIIPYLNDILQKANITLQELDKIIVGIGPGSYTGVRIGVTVAKMIGYLNGIDVYTVSSLALIASSSQHQQIIPYIDARRGNAFITALQRTEKGLVFIEEEHLENIEAFLDRFHGNYDFITEGKPNINVILASDLLTKIEDIHSLQPNYLRITEAERNKRENKN